MKRSTRGPVLSVFIAALAAGCGEDLASRDARLDALEASVAKVGKEVEKANDGLRAVRDELRVVREDSASLAARIADLEARPAGGAASAADPAAASAKTAAADQKAKDAEIDALMKRVFDGEATDEEEQRFWELARTTGRLDELIKSLEAAVKDAPGDADARMNLAQGYISKLLTLPSGPEQAIWSQKAEVQWKSVLEAQPEHWEARYALAFNWSMWPDFLNKTPDAVREFEKLREVQERGTAADHQSDTYFQLSRLYLKQGKRDKAEEILRTGMARHPNAAGLQKALDALEE